MGNASDNDLALQLEKARQELSALSQTLEHSLEDMEKFKTMFEYANDVIVYLGLDNSVIDINSKVHDLFGYTREDCIGVNIYDLRLFDVLAHSDLDRCISLRDQTLNGGPSMMLEFEGRHKDGRKVYFEVNSRAVKKDGKVIGVLSILRDISKRKEDERALRRYQEELERMVEDRTANLEETNTALKVLLRNIENDKTAIKERIHFNIKELVMPYIDQMKKMKPDGQYSAYLDILEKNLKTITAPYIHELSLAFDSFTPTEIKVANLIIQGKTTKEISQIIVSSGRTVESHRLSIRKKLGISNQKVNLRSFLLSANGTAS